MSDNSSSEELEEGNIFQLARVTSARKRRRIQTSDVNNAIEPHPPHQDNEFPPTTGELDSLCQPKYPLLHTISLSPSKPPPIPLDLPSSPTKSRDIDGSPPRNEPSPLPAVIATDEVYHGDELIIETDHELNKPNLSGLDLPYHDDQPASNRSPALTTESDQPIIATQSDRNNLPSTESIPYDFENVHTNEPLDDEPLRTDNWDHEREVSPVNIGSSSNSLVAANSTPAASSSDYSISNVDGNDLESLRSPPPPAVSTGITSVANYSIRNLVAAMPFIEIPFTEIADLSIQIEPILTKAHTTRSRIIQSTISKVRSRMVRDITSINSLQETQISLPVGENSSENLVRQLWTTGSQVGRLAQLNIRVRHLKQTRTELMNQIVEYRSTTGLNRASAQAYNQFKAQVDEARATLAVQPANESTLALVKLRVQELQSELAATAKLCAAREEEYRLSHEKLIAKIKLDISAPSTPASAQSLASIEHAISQAGAKLNARVSFVGSTEMVVQLRYLTIVVDVASHAPPTYVFSYPMIMQPLYNHFERLVMQTHRITEACQLWNRCLDIRAELRPWLAHGPYEFEQVADAVEPTLLFRGRDLRTKTSLQLKLCRTELQTWEPSVGVKPELVKNQLAELARN